MLQSSTVERRKMKRTLFAVLSLLCFFIVLLLTCSTAWHTNRSGDARNRLTGDVSNILSTLSMYASEEAPSGRLQPFGSDKMPEWWRRYSKRGLASGVTYRLDTSAVGERPTELKAGQVVVVATGPLVNEAYGQPLHLYKWAR